ncbi:MAG: malto-oligosyltrehalose trehalohydrolase, partial [Brachybacterium tyrofermentans]
SVEILAEETVLLRRGTLGVLSHRGPGPLADVPRALEILSSFGEASLSSDGTVQMADAGAVILRLHAE